MGSEQTSSSRRVGEVGDEGGMILYVMRTFLALRHMGRVLCVTDQVAWSHSSGGDWKEVGCDLVCAQSLYAGGVGYL